MRARERQAPIPRTVDKLSDHVVSLQWEVERAYKERDQPLPLRVRLLIEECADTLRRIER
jgi:hypothetical protein